MGLQVWRRRGKCGAKARLARPALTATEENSPPPAFGLPCGRGNANRQSCGFTPHENAFDMSPHFVTLSQNGASGTYWSWKLLFHQVVHPLERERETDSTR